MLENLFEWLPVLSMCFISRDRIMEDNLFHLVTFIAEQPSPHKLRSPFNAAIQFIHNILS